MVRFVETLLCDTVNRTLLCFGFSVNNRRVICIVALLGGLDSSPICCQFAPSVDGKSFLVRNGQVVDDTVVPTLMPNADFAGTVLIIPDTDHRLHPLNLFTAEVPIYWQIPDLDFVSNGLNSSVKDLCAILGHDSAIATNPAFTPPTLNPTSSSLTSAIGRRLPSKSQ